MLLELKMPRVIADMPGARIEAIYVRPGGEIGVGGKLCDISIDLGGAFQQNCPPISFYRLVSRERVWLRRITVAAGDLLSPGDVVASLSTGPDESLDSPVARPLRFTTAGILWHSAMWSAIPVA